VRHPRINELTRPASICTVAVTAETPFKRFDDEMMQYPEARFEKPLTHCNITRNQCARSHQALSRDAER
jgi:hypothetical protein